MPHRLITPTRIVVWLRKIWLIFLETLFPWYCLGCKKEAENFPVCSDCLAKIPLAYNFVCPICGRSVQLMKVNTHFKTSFEKISACSHRLPMLALGAAANYNNELVRQMIFTFKYDKVLALKTPLIGLLVSFLNNTNWSTFLNFNWLVIPIPLHRRKYQLRGFNQSEILAQGIARYFSLEIATNLLVRIKNNKPQASIEDNQSRFENAKGIFVIKDSKLVQSRNILLVDDVATTGATILEAAKILKHNKAQHIIGLVVAKG